MRVSLFGYGKTTKALTKIYSDAIFYDDKCHKHFTDDDGFKVKPSSEFNPNYSDLEITSPGIAPSNKLIQEAKHLISEYDVFAKTAPLKIWISGTNGKTTTTQMMQHLLSAKGALCGGNIGTPLADLDQNAPIWILETSSFTIHYTTQALPNLYILLPITPDHLSWHGDMQGYIDDKLKPIKSMKEGEIAIIPSAYKEIDTPAHIIAYENEDDLAQKLSIDTSKIIFKGAFLMDALLAMAADKILFDNINYDLINSFIIEAHRQEELRDSSGRVWVNDTKATNLDATIVAMKRYKEHFVRLILGGDDKGVDLSELFLFLQNYKVKIYNIGSNKEKLSALAQTYNIDFLQCHNLVDAINKIDSELTNDEIALLSPAAASLDEFSSYAHRGDIFKNRVREL